MTRRPEREATPDRLEAMILKTLMERYRRYGYPGDYASIDDRDRAVARAAVKMCEGEVVRLLEEEEAAWDKHLADDGPMPHWRGAKPKILAALRAIRGE